ncbi:MAG TPA: FAD-binding oxidoreductase [Steroidobacteraceae bacterium]|nr:FAD-binding oxidoreductase [Steroidobacteraceae bacterium]
MQTDIAVIGGGVMGSALAYWLTRLDPTVSVTVIERDPAYTTASSALSAASIRQQFTTAVNIRISQQSMDFLRRAGDLLEVNGDRPDIALTERGYLYLAGVEGMEALRAAHAIQRAHGADVALLDAAALAARFPWLDLDGIAAGSLGLRGEGWFDGYSLLTAFARKARSQGARFVRGDVQGVSLAGHHVTELQLGDATPVRCGWAVNAAGPWARAVARLAGIELPVYARRRTVYVIACRAILEGFPLIIDRSGFWIRPEGPNYIGAPPPREDPDDAPLEAELGPFEAELWPALAARIPAFEAAKLERAWAGYYEFNSFDQNGLLGLHPAIDNLAFMNGFSGHGIQQAPVVGRGIAELILTGRYATLDLSDLSVSRLLENRPLRELNVIG